MIFDFTFPRISSKMLPHFMDLGKFWSIIIILEAITININYINLNIIIIDGHTDLKPCYVAPLNKSTVDEPLTPQWSSAPLGYFNIDENESRLKWKRDVRLCEHYYIAGNLHSWYWVYSKIWKINIMSMKLIFWWAYMEHLCYFLGAICGQWDCKWICQQKDALYWGCFVCNELPNYLQILVIWKDEQYIEEKTYRISYHIYRLLTLIVYNFAFSQFLLFLTAYICQDKGKIVRFCKMVTSWISFFAFKFSFFIMSFCFSCACQKKLL